MIFPTKEVIVFLLRLFVEHVWHVLTFKKKVNSMIAYEFSWLKSEVFFIYHCICMIRKQQSLVEHERIGFLF